MNGAGAKGLRVNGAGAGLRVSGAEAARGTEIKRAGAKGLRVNGAEVSA